MLTVRGVRVFLLAFAALAGLGVCMSAPQTPVVPTDAAGKPLPPLPADMLIHGKQWTAARANAGVVPPPAADEAALVKSLTSQR